MTKVKIYGAGSIGNHLAQASRRIGWGVVVVDKDPAALKRMKEEVYPTRYGAWDDAIELYELGKEPKGGFDVIFLGTPPNGRFQLALSMLEEKPKVLQLEKPISEPALKGLKEFLKKLKQSETQVIIGYDHVLSKAVQKATEIIKKEDFGAPVTLDVEFRETWKGIFAAHPWLAGPHETYLGFWEKGGGASGEHSHATNLWQYFAELLGLGVVKEVSAAMQMVEDGKINYDQSCFLHLTTDKGFVGRVVQDVVTDPVKKWARIQFTNGFIEVLINGWEKGDLLKIGRTGHEVEEIKIEKIRRDDFYEEVLHIQDLLDGKISNEDSPISLNRGLHTMRVVTAAHKSRQKKKTIKITK